MKVNKEYGKAVQGGAEVEYAPESFIKDGVQYTHPTRAEYALGGWLPVSQNVPAEPAPEGKHWAPNGWEEAEGETRRKWRLVDDPPPAPRVFSKLKVVAALRTAGKWDAAKAYIEGLDLYDLFLAAQVFAEDNEYFGQGVSALKTELGMTDEQVEEILSACVAEV